MYISAPLEADPGKCPGDSDPGRRTVCRLYVKAPACSRLSEFKHVNCGIPLEIYPRDTAYANCPDYAARGEVQISLLQIYENPPVHIPRTRRRRSPYFSTTLGQAAEAYTNCPDYAARGAAQISLLQIHKKPSVHTPRDKEASAAMLFNGSRTSCQRGGGAGRGGGRHQLPMPPRRSFVGKYHHQLAVVESFMVLV